MTTPELARAAFLFVVWQQAEARYQRNPERDDLDLDRERALDDAVDYVEAHGLNGCPYDPRNAWLPPVEPDS